MPNAIAPSDIDEVEAVDEQPPCGRRALAHGRRCLRPSPFAASSRAISDARRGEHDEGQHEQHEPERDQRRRGAPGRPPR